MKSHDLAIKLLSHPNKNIKASIDISVNDYTAHCRIFSVELTEVQDDSFMKHISLLFIKPQYSSEQRK